MDNKLTIFFNNWQN